ncbi:MAG: Gfo/Idh/MocA family oxidoreductase [Planctomycetes bacterium]|nr:Gfo/Idh/MocA family oxidoreductase [Planctomycetota bacterium]
MALDEAFSRRSFLKGTAGGALAATLAGSSARVLGANERIRLGYIGTGGRGGFHLGQFGSMPDVENVAVCDVDRGHLEGAAKRAGPRAKAFADFRKLIDLKDVDAVVVSPPDHWHAIPTIRACQAAKDVYVEKPIGHNIREGRAIADAAEKNDRIVVIGVQQRSGPHWIDAIAKIRKGDIGKVTLVHVWNSWSLGEMGGGGGQGIGNPPDGPEPEGVDYDMWLGPAPKRAFNPARFHFTFYFHWDYAGGMVSDWGVHLFDVVLWAMGDEVLSAATAGGKHFFKDARETPDTVATTFECPGYTMVYTMRHANGLDPHGGMDHGIEFFGSQATLRINRNGYQILPEGGGAPLSFPGAPMDEPHKRNFLDCVRSRKRPNADALVGHLGAVVSHLANISYRVGRKIVWDPKREEIAGDPEASALLGRTYREPWRL